MKRTACLKMLFDDNAHSRYKNNNNSMGSSFNWPSRNIFL